MTSRRTIAQPATIRGTGLHTGVTTTLVLQPASPNTGIQFQRTDLPNGPRVRATVDAVRDTERRTSLGDGDVTIETVEHVLAAVMAHSIDDLVIALDGPEPPAGDGSAACFEQAIRESGIDERQGEPVIHAVAVPLTVRDGDASYVIGPHAGLRLTVTIAADHPLIGQQAGSYDIGPDTFRAELAGARTFGFASDAAGLRERGLARGATPDNTIVLSEDGLVGSTLRWTDEFVRHKAVDLLGDLALLGARCRADIVAHRPSHEGNVALARTLKRAAVRQAPSIMGIDEILGILPHRYPMLLVDRILEVEEGKRIVGLKNVTINEPFFQGHFPGHPIMPGVLIVEAMAQVGGMLLLGAVEDPTDKVVYFMSIDGVKFRRPVVPGDQIRFELEMLQFRGKTCRLRGVGYVDGRLVAEAEMMARIVDR